MTKKILVVLASARKESDIKKQLEKAFVEIEAETYRPFRFQCMSL